MKIPSKIPKLPKFLKLHKITRRSSRLYYAIIEALNKMAEIFTSHNEDSFEDLLASGLEPLANAVDLDRIVVYRLVHEENYMKQIYVWAFGKSTLMDEKITNFQTGTPLQKWHELLTKGECVNGNVKYMSPSQAKFCTALGVKSVFLTPVFTRGRFWGIIALEDHTNFRYFEEDCIDLLRSAAQLCANAFIRNDITRKATAANEFNRITLNSAPIGFTIFDKNKHIIDCNNTILKLFETTKQYYIDNFNEFSPEFQSDGSKSSYLAYEYIKQSFTDEFKTFKWTHRSSSGKLIPCEISATRTTFNGEDVILVFLYDLSNLKKVEEAAAEAEDLVQAVVQASPIPYVLYDENMTPLDCNNAALRIFACPDKKYFLENCWDRFSPEIQPDGISSLEKAQTLKNTTQIGGEIIYEWTHLSYNGEQIPVENTTTQVIHRGKKLYISYKYDLRNSKRMMENIQEQSKQLKIKLEQQKLITEISKSLVSSGDSETYVNGAIAKLGHYHKVSEVSIYKMDHQNSIAYSEYHWSCNGSLPSRHELDLYSLAKARFPESLPDSSTLPIVSCNDTGSDECKDFHPLLSFNVHAFICVPLYVEGHLWGFLGVKQFHKQRKWTDNELTFVSMIARTIAGIIMRNIYTSKLRSALEKATIASKAKGEFLSNMSHEMRTPLNAIIGMTTICKNTSDLERKNYTLNRIEDASNHLLGVINDILDMSKIEAKKFELAPSEFSFEMMLQRVVNIINFRVEEKQQKFTVYIDRKIPDSLIGDEQRLAQLVTNLVGNAVKFTPVDGSIRIDTELLEEKNGLYTIQIEVTDTGIGISQEQQARLFQSFEQAENDTSRKFGGTGLGLAISKNIAEMMGGKIWIKSELGKGAAFCFTIQLKRGKEMPSEFPYNSENWKNVRILVVDDDTDTLEFFREILAEFGASCDTVRNAEDALNLVEQNKFHDIYFIDWKLPGIDGIELTEKLKQKIGNTDKVSVVLFSAATWNSIEDEANSAGVDKFLSKPLFPSNIINTINKYFYVRDEPGSQTEESLPVFAGRHILLAEDIEINREIVLTLLEPTQVKIDSAENGAIAVQKFREAPDKYDMILMDMQMPEMDGLEATRLIRAFEDEMKNDMSGANFTEGETQSYERNSRKQIPIIAMTANVFQEDVKNCLDAGMNSHLGKPLDFVEVLNKLKTYLLKAA